MNQDSFTIYVDTREQTEWAFSPDVPTERKALPEGDYTVKGLENLVILERKTLSDFVGSVLKKRFKDELKRLAPYKYKCIVVEGSTLDIINHSYTSHIHPMSVLGAAISIHVYHSIPVLFWGNRQIAQVLAEKWLRRVWEKENKQKKALRVEG